MIRPYAVTHTMHFGTIQCEHHPPHTISAPFVGWSRSVSFKTNYCKCIVPGVGSQSSCHIHVNMPPSRLVTPGSKQITSGLARCLMLLICPTVLMLLCPPSQPDRILRVAVIPADLIHQGLLQYLWQFLAAFRRPVQNPCASPCAQIIFRLRCFH